MLCCFVKGLAMSKGVEKPRFPGADMSEANLHSLTNGLSCRLLVHKTIAVFQESFGK